MQEQTKNSLQNVGDKSLARVLVAVGGEKRDILHDYKGEISFVFSDDYELRAPEVFNPLKNRKSYDLFVFLDGSYNFYKEDSLSEMIDYFWSVECLDMGAIYADTYIYHGDNPICIKYNPSFHYYLSKERMVLNIPFICKAKVFPNFNEKLDKLYLWDGILWLLKNTILYHMPKPMFIVRNAMNRENLNNEIKLIYDTHYPSDNSTNN